MPARTRVQEGGSIEPGAPWGCDHAVAITDFKRNKDSGKSPLPRSPHVSVNRGTLQSSRGSPHFFPRAGVQLLEGQAWAAAPQECSCCTFLSPAHWLSSPMTGAWLSCWAAALKAGV